MDDKICSWYNIAQELNVHEGTVKRWCRDDPTFKAIVKSWHRSVFIYKDDLEQWVKKQEKSHSE